MKATWMDAVLVGLMSFWLGLVPAHAGDSLYGTVTEIKAPDVVTLDYGAGQYELKIVGIDVPREGPIAVKAREFVSNLLLNITPACASRAAARAAR